MTTSHQAERPMGTGGILLYAYTAPTAVVVFVVGFATHESIETGFSSKSKTLLVCLFAERDHAGIFWREQVCLASLVALRSPLHSCSHALSLPPAHALE